MQKLQVELKNVPEDASQVPCSTNLSLNKEDTLSVIDGLKNNKLACNNSDVNQDQHTGRSLKAFVYVLNCKGNPLMPCSYAKSKRMVKKGVAKVIKRFPFTIQLNFECENQVQLVTLGIDTGYGNIGFSAVTEKQELISGTLKLDGKTKKRLEERRMYRRNRRNKLWYRKPRWKNRTKPEDWLPPSIKKRYDTHLNLIKKIKLILPISKVVLEIAKFDIQKIENPKISEKDYQQGNLYDYQNIRSYLMAREHGKCQFCSKDFKNQSSHVHHIKPRNQGGNDRPNNLVILHKGCHEELHKKKLFTKLKSNAKDYKHSTFMNIINKRFRNYIPKLNITYGNITFVNRNKLDLEKTHYNDAFVIANGSNQKRVKPIEIIQKHRNNRVLQLNRKGFVPSIRRQRYIIQSKDIFWIGNKKYISNGIKNKGRYITYKTTEKKNYVKVKDISKIFNFGGLTYV